MSDRAVRLEQKAQLTPRIGITQALKELLYYVSPRGNREVFVRTMHLAVIVRCLSEQCWRSCLSLLPGPQP